MRRNDQAIRQLVILNKCEASRHGFTLFPYQITLHFDYDAFVEDSLAVMRGPRISLELEFDKATAAWVKDHIWHPSQQCKQLPRGRMRMTHAVADSCELIGWILSFGSRVRVIRQDSLQITVKQEAAKNGETVTSGVPIGLSGLFSLSCHFRA
ncbi:MAG: WYL domain-containing protein [Nitrospira sp.]|nr:WYL domain-containing protein [Nitrospira sp.]MBH0195357.1 WYL domain-containing protein [Nitrospira sp.]